MPFWVSCLVNTQNTMPIKETKILEPSSPYSIICRSPPTQFPNILIFANDIFPIFCSRTFKVAGEQNRNHQGAIKKAIWTEWILRQPANDDAQLNSFFTFHCDRRRNSLLLSDRLRLSQFYLIKGYQVYEDFFLFMKFPLPSLYFSFVRLTSNLNRCPPIITAVSTFMAVVKV